MKLVDMYFWQVGFLMDTISESDNELIKIKDFAAKFKCNLPSKYKKGNNKCESIYKNTWITNMIREYIISRLNQAKESGFTTIDLKSGDIHKSLKLDNRMPPVCNAMVLLGVFRYEIIDDTPSGASSTKLVRYYL